MKYWIILTLLAAVNAANGQLTEDEVIKIREEHLSELLDTTNSLLNSEERAHFIGLDYYTFDSTYQINATFKKSKGRKFEMPTSTERRPIYRRFGYIDFELNGQFHRLTVYQNISLKKKSKSDSHLFLPFRDATSGNATYGGGRYLDLNIPNGSAINIDFNLAYNPYCAYSIRYSCPIPPDENTLSIPIEAGEKYLDSH